MNLICDSNLLAKLEDLKANALVRLSGNEPVRVVNVIQHSENSIELFFKDSSGNVGNQLLFRNDESGIEIVEDGVRFGFDKDGDEFRLVSEARRIQLAHLFDPYLALHSSNLMPLPHQITAVYQEMLPRQPLRFLLADDPGAGKTIMTGLLIKELKARGDIERCLICAPGSLVEQWQDELDKRFQLSFDIISRNRIEESRTGNAFDEIDFAICRIDQISRNDDYIAKLNRTDWDLIVVDEAHKMAAHFISQAEVKKTKRYKLGEVFSRISRHFLMLTATPHSGIEENFQLFMALLDGDRFEGRFRDGVHAANATDMMRRMVKEKIYRFDGKPLFPERRAYSLSFQLSDPEVKLYQIVTQYVKEEMNRVDRFATDEKKRVAVGFALTVLQRRLASSPAAIHKSLQNRKKRLEKVLREAKLGSRADKITFDSLMNDFEDDEDLYDWLDDAHGDDVEELETETVTYASAASTVRELEEEITTLKRMEKVAEAVKNSGMDKKWEQLSSHLQEKGRDENGKWRKMLIFSEHKDTVAYLVERIKNLIGKDEAVVSIVGGMPREQRRNIQESFVVDPDVAILVATDAASEGVNLQRANLMVNYDLPWNPNRIEQRFGRIHRIGQEEVCHMFNLIAKDTREGDVFERLFEKLEMARRSLGGQVYDVLGQQFNERTLRDMMIEAIRYGETPEVKEKMDKVMNDALDPKIIQTLLEDYALTDDTMDQIQIIKVKESMEKAEARRLQPHYIGSFFTQAFKLLGGKMHRREKGRYEISHVPVQIRERDRLLGSKAAVQNKYERIVFRKEMINVKGKPMGVLMAPGHPLMNAVLDIILEKYRNVLRSGTVLVDPNPGEKERVLFYLENSVVDGLEDVHGKPRLASRKMQFVEMYEDGKTVHAGPAPYLDYRNPTEKERKAIDKFLESPWLKTNLEEKAVGHAIEEIVPDHLNTVKVRRQGWVDKTDKEVRKRLTTEIKYWDNRCLELREKERKGKNPRFMNSAKARKRCEELEERLRNRLNELNKERDVKALPPVVSGGALIIPASILEGTVEFPEEPPMNANETERVERLAMDAVMDAERKLGFEPKDVGDEYLGYDVESKGEGVVRMIEVKGRIKGANHVTVSRNEILTGLNTPDNFILAVVIIDGETAMEPVYIRKPFDKEPDFNAHSVNYKLKKLIRKGSPPS